MAGYDARTVLVPLAVVILFGVIMQLAINTENRTKNTFKTTVLTDYLAEHFEELTLNIKKGLPKDTVLKTKFLNEPDTYRSYDHLSGTIDGIAFESADVVLKAYKAGFLGRSGFGKSTTITWNKQGDHTEKNVQKKGRLKTYFHGRVFVFDFHKQTQDTVLVYEHFNLKKRTDFHRVKVEGVTFNELFTIYATNKQTAFYILTPHFMETLLKLEADHPGELGFAFSEGKLYFVIHHGRDTFPMKPIRKGKPHAMTLFKRDVEKLYDLIHDLKQNDHIV